MMTQAQKNRARSFSVAGIFLLPAVILCFVFHYYCAFNGFLYSFFEYDYVDPPGVFVGLDNYIVILKSELFWQQMKNTLIFWAIGTGLTFLIPVFQALILNEIKGKANKVFEYLYILPMALPGVAGIAIWRYMFNADSGILNSLIGVLGISPKNWLFDENLIRWAINIPGMVGGGMNLLIYTIAIGGIDPGLYEAAELDGASRFKQMLYITIPQMSYMIKLQFLLCITGSLLAFGAPYQWTDGTGGPNKAVETVVFGIYNRAYDLGLYGQAMATSMILLAFTLILLGIRKLLARKSED